MDFGRLCERAIILVLLSFSGWKSVSLHIHKLNLLIAELPNCIFLIPLAFSIFAERSRKKSTIIWSSYVTSECRQLESQINPMYKLWMVERNNRKKSRNRMYTPTLMAEKGIRAFDQNQLGHHGPFSNACICPTSCGESFSNFGMIVWTAAIQFNLHFIHDVESKAAEIMMID